jgi:predicted MFS family arabinose efflux permease
MSAEVCATPVGELAEAPEVNWRRLVAVFALTQTVGFVALTQAFSVLLVPMTDDLGISRTAAAGAATVSTLVGAVAAMPVGRLLDRYGGRWVMSAGSLVGVLAVVLWSQAHSVAHLYLAFGLAGLALAMSAYEAAFSVLVVATEHAERDRAILAVTMVAGVSTYLAYPPLGWLATQVGWRHTVELMAVLLLVVSVPLHVWSIPGSAVHARRARRRPSVPIGAAVRQTRFWLLTASFVAQSAATSAVLLLLITYLLDIGHSVAVATSVPLAVGVLQILSRLALVTLAGRLSLPQVTAASFAIQGVGLLALPLVGLSIPLTVLCVSAVGLANGVAVIARPSILADAFGAAQFASIMAAITVPMALARAGAPLGAAWLSDWRFLVLAGLASLGAALALLPLTLTKGRPS